MEGQGDTTDTSPSPIRRGFAPGFVNYKKGCTRLAAASDKVYQLLAHGWFHLDRMHYSYKWRHVEALKKLCSLEGSVLWIKIIEIL
jgi:hypothetical protein